MQLKDRTVLVTGASSGIGRAIAVALAERGATVLINYRKNTTGAEETLRQVEKHSKGHLFQADLTDEAQIMKMFTEISEKVGDIDILVNNAGDAQPGDFFDTAHWRSQFDNIFFSALQVSQHFLKQNQKSELRQILNITSVYGERAMGNSEFFAYSVAKAAMSQLTVTQAKMDAKVLVNGIAPGYTWTPPWESISAEEKKLCEARTVIGRYVKQEEIAHMAVAILENDAMTGQIVTVDGGLALQKLERK